MIKKKSKMEVKCLKEKNQVARKIENNFKILKK